jgi:hypothetical protein
MNSAILCKRNRRQTIERLPGAIDDVADEWERRHAKSGCLREPDKDDPL